jgi:histidyl-tRNA synthetase
MQRLFPGKPAGLAITINLLFYVFHGIINFMISIVKGTKDILDAEQWQRIEQKALEIFSKYGYREIRTPVFEYTELFSRGVGDTTDIVNKEMYTFEINKHSLTLRPEGTAGVVRSYIENGMSRLSPPVKLWYKGPMFRYERPQAGRQRQFHQVGAELFGVKEAAADAEVILLAVNYLKSLGLNDLEVELNSLGCPDCRENYKKAIKTVLKQELKNLCADCQSRYEKNPLRLLDCKVDGAIFAKAEIQKVIQSDFICGECAAHFSEVKSYLDGFAVKYRRNKQLVRGLDYYNRTVFEIKSDSLGSQNAVCGGGRYDGLVGNLGGADAPAVGWAMGMERLNSLLAPLEPIKSDAYVISNSAADAFRLAEELRIQGLSVEIDLSGKKFTKQLEKASKAANFALIIGEDEMKAGTVSVKNLCTGVQTAVKRKDARWQILLKK